MRTKRIIVLVSPEEHSQIKRLAYASGLPVSAYARMVLLGAVTTSMKKREFGG